MLVVEVRNNNIEKALKVLKGKVINTKQLNHLREGQYYQKKSVKRRKQVIHAKYLQDKKDKESY